MLATETLLLKTKDAKKTTPIFPRTLTEVWAEGSHFCRVCSFIVLVIQKGVGSLRDAVSQFTCGWLVLSSSSHSFHCPYFSLPGYSV